MATGEVQSWEERLRRVHLSQRYLSDIEKLYKGAKAAHASALKNGEASGTINIALGRYLTGITSLDAALDSSIAASTGSANVEVVPTEYRPGGITDLAYWVITADDQAGLEASFTATDYSGAAAAIFNPTPAVGDIMRMTRAEDPANNVYLEVQDIGGGAPADPTTSKFYVATVVTAIAFPAGMDVQPGTVVVANTKDTKMRMTWVYDKA